MPFGVHFISISFRESICLLLLALIPWDEIKNDMAFVKQFTEMDNFSCSALTDEIICQLMKEEKRKHYRINCHSCFSEGIFIFRSVISV